MEEILPAVQCILRKPTFTIRVTKSREQSINWEKKDGADFKVYSDGSGREDGIGAAAVMYTKERVTENKMGQHMGCLRQKSKDGGDRRELPIPLIQKVHS